MNPPRDGVVARSDGGGLRLRGSVSDEGAPAARPLHQPAAGPPPRERGATFGPPRDGEVARSGGGGLRLRGPVVGGEAVYAACPLHQPAAGSPPRERGGTLGPSRDGVVARSGGGGSPSLRRAEVYDARRARRELSLPEVLLWQRLKGAPQGVRFRRQHPIGAYRADFYCAASKLVIEIDGIAHDMGDRPARDVARTLALEHQGYRVVRVAAADVLRDADDVAQAIVTQATVTHTARPLHQPVAGPPPRERGGSFDPPRDGGVARSDGGGLLLRGSVADDGALAARPLHQPAAGSPPRERGGWA